MLTLSPVWHRHLLTANRAGNFLLQTLVIHPALLFFLLFLLNAHSPGGGGQWLLNEAEKLVRDAPAGQVWGCVSQAMPVKAFPPAPLTEPRNGASVPSPPGMCVKAAVSRDAWAAQTNDTLLFLYKAGVVFSVISGLTVRHFRRRVNGENV
ncbi:hypothetical protein BEE12_22800 (plasmid) [Pantoea agglomerans]|uniref:hypothetical protein n=1 Tax=Enterobacter agglomerans TaxID=549 RepID=UPI00083E4105|nr:hypothetical protein [Pantoea agglomerans]AOE42620.1 hypothetical protein BEE12_22800 [Pantoea agglomerans]